MALAVSQAVKIEASGGTSVTVNNAITFTAGALAVAGVSIFLGTASNIAASDSVNGAYTGRTAQDNGNPGWRFCDKNNISSGLANLTADGGASTSGLVGLWHEVTGQDTGTAFDTQQGTVGSSTAPDTVNVTNTNADSIYFAGGSFSGSGNPITYTINASGSEGTWLEKSTTNSRELDGNTYPACGVVYQIVSSASGRSHTWTTANAAWACASVVYKAAAAAGDTQEWRGCYPMARRAMVQNVGY